MSPDVVSADSDDEEAVVLERYMRAWEKADLASLATLLKEDAEMTMPPAPAWFAGRDAIVTWFSTSPFVFGDPTRRMRMLPTRANGLPALAVYTATGEAEQLEAYGIMVLRIEDGAVVEITGFGDCDLHRLFGLPGSVGGIAVSSARMRYPHRILVGPFRMEESTDDHAVQLLRATASARGRSHSWNALWTDARSKGSA